jgi:hypothetical protein
MIFKSPVLATKDVDRAIAATAGMRMIKNKPPFGSSIEYLVQ